MTDRCLVCHKPVESDGEYHPACSRKIFGVFPAPEFGLTLDGLANAAAESVLARASVTGVQKKLSLGLTRDGRRTRLTIVGMWGRFVLKPPSDDYPYLPENEFTVMRQATLLGIPTVPHALVRLASGELAYISRRVDRTAKGVPLAMEDFCQVSLRLTEDKYKGSVERIGKLLRTHSVFPGLDALDFYERVMFSYLSGNADMHLKNYSLLETPEGMRLAPAYDLVSTVLVLPDDPEQSALTIDGRKSKITAANFKNFARSMDIPESAVRSSHNRFRARRPTVMAEIANSRLPPDMRSTLSTLYDTRLALFG